MTNQIIINGIQVERIQQDWGTIAYMAKIPQKDGMVQQHFIPPLFKELKSRHDPIWSAPSVVEEAEYLVRELIESGFVGK